MTVRAFLDKTESKDSNVVITRVKKKASSKTNETLSTTESEDLSAQLSTTATSAKSNVTAPASKTLQMPIIMDKHRTTPTSTQLPNGPVHSDPVRMSPPKKDGKSFVQFMKDRFNKSADEILPLNTDPTNERSTSKSPTDMTYTTTTSSINRVSYLSPNSTFCNKEKLINYKPPMSPPREASPTRNLQHTTNQQHFKSILHNKLNNITNETRVSNRHRQSKSVDLSSDDKLNDHSKEMSENIPSVQNKSSGGGLKNLKKERAQDIVKTAKYSLSEPNLSANMTVKSDSPSTPSKYSHVTSSNTKLDFVRRSYSFDDDDDDDDDVHDDDDELNGLINGVELDNNSSSGCGSENRFEDIYDTTNKQNGHAHANPNPKKNYKLSNL
jgi:hypothetical protein